jgi:Rrf2 family protein
MRLTKATDYGLLLVAYLLTRPRDSRTSIRDSRTSIKEAAAACQIPPRFLASIVRQLTHGGLLATTRGVHGGVWLTETGARATIRQVLEAIEGSIDLTDCQRRPGLCQNEPSCFMKAFWAEVQGQFLDTLGATTVAELALRASAAQAPLQPTPARAEPIADHYAAQEGADDRGAPEMTPPCRGSSV